MLNIYNLSVQKPDKIKKILYELKQQSHSLKAYQFLDFAVNALGKKE